MYTLVFGLKSVLIAAAITPLAEAAVKFTTMPSYQTYVKNGSTAKLAWEYSDPNNDLMGIVFSVLVNGVFRRLLYKHNGVVKYHRNVPPAYKGRVSMEGNGTLVIKKVTPKDNTIFQCILLDSYSDIISTVRLIVAEAPKISLSSAHGICVVEGSFLNISCTASGKPEPGVTWIKNRIEISSGKKAALLIISRIRRTDDGLYTCRANNSIKIASQNRTLLVHYKPEGTRLLSSAPENSIEQGGKVTLTCTVTAAKPPVSQYRFIFNGTVVKHSNDNQYTISNVRRSLHYGEYKCVPSNTVGNGAEASMVLDVYDPPSIKDITTSARTSWINQTVTLKCVSDGNPTPTLTWYRPDGREVKAVRAKENKVHMLLKGDQDFGDYKCKAAYGLTPSDENKIKIRQIKKPGLASIISSQADIQASSLVAKWASPADDGGSPITAYRAILLKGDTEINRVNITNPDTTSYTFGDLERGTKYTVKVFTRNFVFEGDAAVRTLETKFVGPPAAPEVYNGPSETGKTTIILKWKEPENNGEQLTKYIVYQKVVNDGKRGSWKEIKVITDVSLRELEVHLKRGKVYEIAVTAINGYGESLKQNKANVKVLKETPGRIIVC